MDLIEPQQAILEMNFRDDRNLTSSAMSEDGHWIAVADIEEVKLFRIDENVSNTSIFHFRILHICRRSCTTVT